MGLLSSPSPWGKATAGRGGMSASEARRRTDHENDPGSFKNRRKAHAAKTAAQKRKDENARKAAQENARKAARAAAKRRGGK